MTSGSSSSSAQGGPRLPRRRFLAGSAAGAGAGLLLGSLRGTPASAQGDVGGIASISSENALPGTTEWKLTNPANDTALQVRAFCRQTSVKVGERLQIAVHANRTQAVSAKVYRMGYYGGTRGRLVADLGSAIVSPQPAPVLNGTTGEITCNWATAFDVAVPASWPSGIYLVRLRNADGFDTHAIFCVVSERPSGILFQQSVLNYQAYNQFPEDGVTGKSTYDKYSSGAVLARTGGRNACEVNFDRPYQKHGAGLFELFEADFVAWLEQQGYDVTYCTNIDLETGRVSVTNYRVLVSGGHDEYWTQKVWDEFHRARNAGVHLFFSAANHAYWRVSLEAGPSGQPNRRMVAYKDVAANDPQKRPGGRFPDEQSLVGVQYVHHYDFPDGSQNVDYIPINTSHWVWQGAGLTDGVPLGVKLSGYEVDRNTPSKTQPPGAVTKLASSPYYGNVQETSIYQAPSGAWVFGAGTMSWTWGLARPGFTHPAIQRAAANILGRMLTGYVPPSTSTTTTTQPPTTTQPTTPPGPGVLAFAPFGSASAFVAQQYRDLLNREPDAGGLAYWTGGLSGDGSDRPRLIEQFIRSPEFAPWFQLARLYKAVFDRIPDPQGYRYWFDRFTRGELDLFAIATYFVASPEWVRTYGPFLGSGDVVDLVYRNIFDRGADAIGRAYWVSRLDGGMSRAELVLGFSESAEFQAVYGTELDIIAVVQGLLRRPPTDAELAAYLEAVRNSGWSTQTIIGVVLASSDYNARFR